MSRARSIKAAKGRCVPVPRPTFEPCWNDAEAVRMANEHLAPDSAVNVAFRIAECARRLLHEAEEALKGRLEILTAAKARILMTACFVHGVELPRG